MISFERSQLFHVSFVPGRPTGTMSFRDVGKMIFPITSKVRLSVGTRKECFCL